MTADSSPLVRLERHSLSISECEMILLHVSIEFMEVDVGEERADYSSLWRAGNRFLVGSFLHDAGL